MAKIAINITTGSLQQEDVIVGIDLGTTNSLIAIMQPETRQPIVLREFDGTALVPSIIHFGPGGQVNIGDAAKPYLIAEPEHTVFSVKRLMGKSYQDVKDHAEYYSYRIIDDGSESLVKIQVDDRFYSPVELSSFILKELKKRAEHILKTAVNRAVITVPAYFNDAQRQATRDAGKLAGLDVLRIINEPTAASLAYGLGLNATESKIVAVYDLGGGTFDISILRITGGIFEVLSTHGDTYLGGDDMDRAVAAHWSTRHKISRTDKQFLQALRLKAEEAKKFLSAEDGFADTLEGYQLELSRTTLEELILPLVARTIESCRHAVGDAGVSLEQIDEVVMVGGATRVPLVRSMVSSYFGRAVNDSLNPDEVVALGAALQADILAGNNKEFLLLDITPLSLGIETMGGLMDVLIPRNSKIPAKAARQYTTQKDGQSSMRISVYQGERDLVRDNRKLAEFNLTGIPGMPAGLPKVEVSFLINADGILVVMAKELRSGVQQSIEVKPQYGLTDEEVERLLMESISHAKEDLAVRALIEARTEAQQLLETTKQFLAKHESYLSREEVRSTHEAMQELEALIPAEDKDRIHAAIAKLNEISRPYAERVMDEAIATAMRGKRIN
ncbi:MAG TPA: Fe-S protein assembly chaperone HscA [Chitinophagaceae bacterium]|nr:Fe-S protein assembly chaperone HscA [Chitinophagaceae bacterium]